MRKPPAALQPVLWPLSLLYGAAMRIRAGLYARGILRQRRLQGAVVSVGNLTVGGTGKTPMVLWLAEKLAAQGELPAILTRGYRGQAQPGTDGLTGSDEVSILRDRLAGRALFGVGKDRYVNGLALERQGAKWFILDDGLQHLRLARDANIVLLDASDPFGGGHVLPAGRLREPRSSLVRADIVVITRTEHAPALETLARRLFAGTENQKRVPIFYAQTELESVIYVKTPDRPQPAVDYRGAKFFAFCGIGNPSGFFDDLSRWGMMIVGRRHYRDHHRYSVADLRSLEAAAKISGADALICTEKDMVNLSQPLDVNIPVYCCRIRLRLNDPEGYWQAIEKAVAGSRRSPKGQLIRQDAGR